jgi:hypothetical protein
MTDEEYDESSEEYYEDVCEGLGITVMTPKEYFLQSCW